MAVAPFYTENTGPTPPPGAGAIPRVFSFQHVATAILTGVGFVGLCNGLTHMMNGSWLFAGLLSLIIQALAVVAVHNYKRARDAGGAFRMFRGVRWLVLYTALACVIVTFSYSFYYRLMRADRAAVEVHATQSQAMLGTLARLDSRYRMLAAGFSSLAESAEARAKEEEARGNTCSIASPKGAGPIRNFRRHDALAFKEYAALVGGNVGEIATRTATLRAQVMNKSRVREVQASMNDLVGQINSALIGNPMLPGLVQFIDGRLLAGDNISYFGKTIKCDDDQRTGQLIALRIAAQTISREPALPPVELFDPDSVQENALLAANRIAALVEWGLSLGRKNLEDLDPSIKGRKLSTGGKVYIAEDYLPLLFAAVIELLLFLAVPAPARDLGKRDFIDGIASGADPLSWANMRRLLWMGASAPVEDEGMADLSEPRPLQLPPKFVRLRPYLHSFGSRHYLVIPHGPYTARIHDFADALMLKNHAKPVIEESLVVGELPSDTWIQRLEYLLAPHHGITDWKAPIPSETLADIHKVAVRVLLVSRGFFAWMIARVVEMDEQELKPEPPLPRVTRVRMQSI